MNTNPDALLTDLYQLTMLKGYFDRQMNGTAVFEFFVRRLPENRNFLVAAGLEQALEFLENFHFTDDEINWLGEEQNFPPDFLNSLRQLRFNGDVDAMPEGTLFWENEPILRVTAPLPIAQLVETRLINLLQLSTMIASKAARCVLAAPGKNLVEFGLRRTHGAEAGMMAARATYLAGFAGTSNVLAGKQFGIPLFGTVAHAFIQAHGDEQEAFEHFARSNPNNVVFLLDTYDTLAAARKVIPLAAKLKAENIAVRAVRLDSGDLAALAREVRAILDAGGLKEVRILASGNLEENELQRLTATGAPIDGFGVGTRVVTSWDMPYLECAYKLMEYDGKPSRKYSEGKKTWPGPKQVFRKLDADGIPAGDTLTLEGDALAGEPMLQPVMRAGKRVGTWPSLAEVRQRTVNALERLPKPSISLKRKAEYPVGISPKLQHRSEEMDRLRGA